MTEKFDSVNHPSHYTCYEHEVIELTEKLDFCLGNAVKYILRADHKGNKAEDLRKVAWYLSRILSCGENWFEGLLPDSEDDESYEIEKLVESFGNLTLIALIDAIACEDDVAVNGVIYWLRSEADDYEKEEGYEARIRELEEENRRLAEERFDPFPITTTYRLVVSL